MFMRQTKISEERWEEIGDKAREKNKRNTKNRLGKRMEERRRGRELFCSTYIGFLLAFHFQAM